jgi:hypothetical protein
MGERVSREPPARLGASRDPQLAQVGLTETEAKKRGLDIRVAKLPMSGVARALEVGEPRGLMNVIVDANTDQILGCVVLGIEGGETRTGAGPTSLSMPRGIVSLAVTALHPARCTYSRPRRFFTTRLAPGSPPPGVRSGAKLT